MTKHVDHIGMLVSNINEGTKLCKDCFGVRITKFEILPERGVKVALPSFAHVANLELLEPLPDALWPGCWKTEARAFATSL